ncbi:MAG: DUF3488 and transglutaminase-like domain-containing protein [Actinomycetia bacterium]|nr:DUF3488 and transglutaminase-like domain-containing protein [Actinomycetes bacterium]
MTRAGPADGPADRTRLRAPVERAAARSGARRTLAALVATCLAILPLRQIFTDWTWLLDAWAVLALTILPAVALRLRYSPQIVHLLPGIVLALGFLTARYVPDHAVGGVAPFAGAWSDAAALTDQVRQTIQDASAPLASTAAIRMVLSAQLALLALAVDLLGVIARRPALTGLPFLLIFTLAGAVPRHAVALWWFAAAAGGFLLLLAADKADELSRWGRVLLRSPARRNAVAPLSGRRIGIAAVVLALAVPVVVPVRGGNLLSDALHHDVADGTGSGGALALDPFAALKGDLTLSDPVDLLRVRVAASQLAQLKRDHYEPFYLRTEVLDTFDGSGWHASSDGRLERLYRTAFRTVPSTDGGTTYSFTATIDVVHQLAGNVPVFALPIWVDGAITAQGWSPKNALVVSEGLRSGQSYTENVQAPFPTADDLTSGAAEPDLPQFLDLPQDTPTMARDLAAQLTGGTSSPYLKALAVSNYFTDPANGFVYSLKTKGGDSTSDLVNFLKNKAGYCQQYAAAMAVLLRLAGVPARVVLGYTHGPLDGNGQFVVTTRDAHAWVEAFLPPIGWVPFDPTPLSGADAGRSVGLPWAPAGGASTAAPPSNDAQHGGAAQPSRSASAPAAPSAPPAERASAGGGLSWPAWLVASVAGGVAALVALALIPAAVRLGRRRARLAGPAAGPDSVWTELRATATDLGYPWSAARTPRQVLSWLGGRTVTGAARESLAALASAVERARYAPAGETTPAAALISNLRQVEKALRDRRPRLTRSRARLLPASLRSPSRRRRLRRS